MCDKIKHSFLARGSFGKNNLRKKNLIKIKVEECFCGKFWITTASGERMEVKK